MSETNGEKAQSVFTDDKPLAISVQIELNEQSEPMIKIAGFDNNIAAAFRFPLRDGFVVANLIRDEIHKLIREYRKQNRMAERSIFVAEGDSAIRFSKDARKQMGSS